MGLSNGIVFVKKKGRPKGVKNGQNNPLIPPWQPLTWLPVYDTMIAHFVCGMGYKGIGELLDYHPVQVGNIVRSDEGKKKIESYRNAIEGKRAEDIPTLMGAIRNKAVERVHEVLHNEALAFDSPLAMGNFAKDVLKGTGIMNEGSVSSVSTTNIMISSDIAERLMSGLAAADRVRLSDPNNIDVTK